MKEYCFLLFRYCLPIAFVLLITGCQEELFKSLPEQEANEIVAILSQKGISAQKVSLGSKENSYQVTVDEASFSQAVSLLKLAGYPRRKHANLGEIFEPSGLVPTPFEEQVRYIYGVSEELAHTISLLDGVTDTRVHVGLPEQNNDKRRNVSIFIKHDERFDLGSFIPQIKKLAADSVDSVEYEDVEVIAQPGVDIIPSNTIAVEAQYRTLWGISVKSSDYWRLVGALAIGMFFSALVGGILSIVIARL